MKIALPASTTTWVELKKKWVGKQLLNSAVNKDPRNIGRGVEDAYSKFGREIPQSVRENIDAARSGKAPKGLEL